MKIVCSIGPNAKKLSALDEYANEGMNMARFNFSHANYDTIRAQIEYLRKQHPFVEVIQDLRGNKLRVSSLFQREVKVMQGSIVYFCSEKFYYEKNRMRGLTIPISLEGDFSTMYSAKKILMKDATIEFEVVGTGSKNELIKTIVKRGGLIRAEKGVNAPGMDRSMLGITEKDKFDIKWGLENNVDIICLSYVTKVEDIINLRDYIKLLRKADKSLKMPKIWAKIECDEGVKNFKDILSKVDGIILGRGDLAAEVEIYDVPRIQEEIFRVIKRTKKEFIIATHLLESMKREAVPTLPEINDIYNYIKAGATGFMLCGELTVGRNPLETIRILKLIIDRYKIVSLDKPNEVE
ncbi:pyruvate kinase [Clostridium omnivorum]|uniref:Pyruvate kinase n=1 Tax=Clostridium omnivorum TaxID=1604902 RepID=A0ABQ5N9X3_9CLOT|nr:pyruvate kinase [Clostridium sp. E14]GLC32024.1 hypothetical protein bsdE14_34340 [Clostridium sp. E14]